MLYALLALAAGALATFASYPRHTLSGPRVRAAAVLRGLAVALIAALGLNVPLGGANRIRPIVALDASASWGRGGDTTRFAAARRAALAEASDSVLAFGDSIRRATEAQVPSDALSRLRGVAERAIAAGRPLVIYTDGELDDADIVAALPSGSRVEVAPAPVTRDAAVTEILAPQVASVGDTVEVRVTVGAGAGGSGAGRLALSLDGRATASVAFDSLGAYGERSLTLRVVAPAVAAGTTRGERELRVALQADGDADARNDTAATALDIGSAAAAVLVSTSPDLDARELAALLRGTSALPTRVYYQVAAGQWREDGALTAVSQETIRRAVREAGLVVLHGDTALFGPPRAATRGSLALVAPPPAGGGEWFATGAPVSPISSMLTGTPWDSLPPLEVAATMPQDAAFEMLEARRARRLDRRVAIVGWEQPRRILVAGASGFWRWRFRGGAGADAFTAVWGSSLDWLAGERADVRAAVPDAPAVRDGEMIRWRRGSASDTLVRALVRRRAAAAAAPDTVVMRFGASTSVVETPPLAPGVYDVETTGGTSLLVVNPTSELLPRRPTVSAGAVGSGEARGERRQARDLPWLFILAVAALCVEWVLRRGAGLR
jgi:hypothetical protein